MPWPEILMVIGIMAETVVLKALLAMGGAGSCLGAVGIALILSTVLIGRRPVARQHEEWSSDVFMALILSPPAILVVVLLVHWVHGI